MMKKVVLSGVRPTGKQHLGHWVGTLSKWVDLQRQYRCFFMVADWHALMSEYKCAAGPRQYIFDNVCEWLSYGISPESSVIFVQSQVPQHIELFMLLSYITPLGWLTRCPTFKEQQKQLKDKEINTYAFLGYPVLQSCDIILYKAAYVPVGEDQLAHLELCREIVRRFHFLYGKEVFLEPQPLLTKIPRLLGVDGRKMSKSYNNAIALDEEDEEIKKKVLTMFTDPARKRKDDKGHPDICNVFDYYKIFKPESSDEVYAWCSNAKRGCKECKMILAEAVISFIAPRREKKKALLKKKNYIHDLLDEGQRQAETIAAQTLDEAKTAMGL